MCEYVSALIVRVYHTYSHSLVYWVYTCTGRVWSIHCC